MHNDLRTQFLNYMSLQRFSPYTKRSDSETGNIMSEALDRYYTRQLNKYPNDTLLSRLLVPKKP